VDSVPPDTEVLLDGTSLGTVNSGTFKKDISPASHHTITLRKQNYVDYADHREQIAAGQTITVDGAQMKPFGKLIAKVTPPTATITYKRNGEQHETQAQNNQEVLLSPGDYVINASAEGYSPDQQGLTIVPGKLETYAIALQPKVVIKSGPIVPDDVFVNGKSWTYAGGETWWSYAEKGFSFLRKDGGTFTFALPRDTKPFLKEKVKKYEFVADYTDDNNKILYSLDQHHLIRRVFVDGKERKDERGDTSVNTGEFYRLTVQISPDNIGVKVNGSSDVTKRLEKHGKFGFVNEVVLVAQRQ
jgi:hypothetical protein